MSHEYDDIINLPHHVSKHHPQMSMMNRAAQFAPFAAVAGHDAAIREEGRLTDEWIEMGEYGFGELNRKMELLQSGISSQPTVTIDYFLPDEHKSGGSYKTISDQVKRIDDYERVIEMSDGQKVPIDSIRNMTIKDL